MESLLKDAGLEHLNATLASLSLTEAFALSRPQLLDRLKEMGVAKIPERQKVAKAIATGRRELEGTGLPIIVVAYSTGLSPENGREKMQPLIQAAKDAGFVDSIVLDHANVLDPNMECQTLDALVDKMLEIVWAVNETWRSRPWILIGHSNGCVPAYGLARRLGPKVRLCCVLGRRPPTAPLVPELFGCNTVAEVGTLSAHELAQRMATVYENGFLKAMTASPDVTKWSQTAIDAVEIARQQYGHPCLLCCPAEITASICSPGADPPLAARISAPIVGIASSREPAEAETAAKMAEWATLTTGGFQLEALDTDHMGLATHAKAIQMVLEAMRPTLPQPC